MSLLDAAPPQTIEGDKPPASTEGSAPPAPPPAAPGDRPGWLPEKFKSPEDLARSYGELEKRLSGRDEELKAKWEAERLAGRPEKPDAYKLPEVPGVADDQPLTSWWRGFAHEAGLSQEQFEKAISAYTEAMAASQPKPEAEIAKLGDNAAARLQALSLWAGKTFDAEELEAVRRAATTAAGVRALEKLMGSAAPTDERAFEAAGPAEDDEATIRKLMDSKAYWSPNDRDPAVMKRVEDFYARQAAKARR